MGSSSGKGTSYDDFIRPGEEGFTSFPKHVPDDCVNYTIHFLNASNRSPYTLRSRLLEIRSAANSLTKSLLSDYIWQREAFNLNLVPSLDEPSPQAEGTNGNAGKDEQEILHLHGRTSFGDSIADEWLVVYLLRELSKKFEDAWIRVWDADGEFLLVEAANVLPKWLNPEVAEYRVWMNRGQLKIIPRYLDGPTSATDKVDPASSSASTSNTKTPGISKKSMKPHTPRTLTLSYALDYLNAQTTSPALLHDAAIEAEAFHRIRNYPADIASSMHTSLVGIPRKLAYILHRCPAHISPAIEAFYLRDPIALRPLRDNAPTEALVFPPRDFVDVAVKFTRVGFAQLRGQDFAAPKPWRAAVSDAADGIDGRLRKEMGMKLACGFEMLLADLANVDNRALREIGLLLEDLESGEEELPTEEEIAKWGRKVDDEGWLDVDFEQFEKELSGRQGGKEGAADIDGLGGFGDKSAQANLRRMVERFEQLLKDDNEDGSEDEMNFDDDEDDDIEHDDEEEEEEDGEEEVTSQDESGRLPQAFDEEKFTSMMKQLGLPVDAKTGQNAERQIWEVDSDDEPVDEEEMKKAMEQMEAELRELGVFDW